MRAFPGQLSGLGLQGTQGLPWTIAPFYVRAFQSVIIRYIGFFRVDVE